MAWERKRLVPSAIGKPVDLTHEPKNSAASRQWITLEDANYPQALQKHTILLRIRSGSIEPCDHLGLAMVGSRRASAYGLESARRLAIQMARAQVRCISRWGP